jgi:hypothetical protein
MEHVVNKIIIKKNPAADHTGPEGEWRYISSLSLPQR